jgi:hypothetical protein
MNIESAIGIARATSQRATSQPEHPIFHRGVARRHAGQGMTEYIIVVALIAVAAIGVYTLFGQTIRNQTAGLALEVSGQTASTAIGNAQTNATTASTTANVRKGLDNSDANNR